MENLRDILITIPVQGNINGLDIIKDSVFNMGPTNKHQFCFS